MNTDFITPAFCYTAAVIAAFITAVSQILLKKQANITGSADGKTGNDNTGDGNISDDADRNGSTSGAGTEGGRRGKSFFSKFLNRRVILSYILLFMTLVINQIALIYVPVSVMPCITATSFVWVFVLSVIILKEKVSARRAIGVAIIITGVIVSRL